jgi:hypothetical protein
MFQKGLHRVADEGMGVEVVGKLTKNTGIAAQSRTITLEIAIGGLSSSPAGHNPSAR